MNDHRMGWPPALDVWPSDYKSPGVTPTRPRLTKAEEEKRKAMDRKVIDVILKPTKKMPVEASKKTKTKTSDDWNQDEPPDLGWYIVAGRLRIKTGDNETGYMRYWNGYRWSLSCPVYAKDRTKTLDQYGRARSISDKGYLLWLRRATEAEIAGLEYEDEKCDD